MTKPSNQKDGTKTHQEDDSIKVIAVQIHNFRSLKEIEVTFDSTTVLIGENNSGKTSFLEALHFAIGAGRHIITVDDIFLGNGENKVPKDRTVTIDLLIRPVDLVGKIQDTFPEGSYWVSLWGIGIAQDNEENDFVAIRTQMKWNNTKGEYVVDRKFLLDWPEIKTWEDARINEKAGTVSTNKIEPISIYYMDAKRDIEDELHDRSSFWHKLISEPGLTSTQIEEIETELNKINEKIVSGSVVLSHVQTHLNDIYKTIPCEKSSISISPLTRHIRDLSKGMDISFTTNESQSFPLIRHGMGTRCLAALLIFRAYSEWRQKRFEGNKVHSMLALEEPEAHLHPQAQRALYTHIEKTHGQRIITTHSPYIAGQADITQLRHFSKNGSVTTVNQIDVSSLQPEDIRKIKREVLNTRGDLLYARGVILCSGETEEQALPLYLEKYWGYKISALGLTVIGVGGDGKYLPFLYLASGLNIKWYIFSDGEATARKCVEKALCSLGVKDITTMKNVFVLPDGHCWESYLINQGYTNELKDTLNSLHSSGNYITEYIHQMNNQKAKSERARNYVGDEGEKQAIIDCICGDKTKYATPVAQAIVNVDNDSRRIPLCIKNMCKQIDDDLKITVK